MSILYLFFFSLLIYIAGFAPGEIIAVKLTLSTEEKFAVSFGLSFLLYYLIGFLGYTFHIAPFITYAFLILLSLFVGLYHRKLRKHLTSENHHHYLLIFFLFFLVTVGLQAFLPSYNGGLWYFDWVEHYLRSLFFLQHQPLDTLIGSYLLPARPPLFNIVVYAYQTVLGDSFWIYQIIATLLNITLILPCFLICKNILNIKGKYLFIILGLILLLTPSILTQITYTWTKGLSAYYLLMGLYFYIKSRTQNNLAIQQFSNVIISALFLSSAFLTHYSALPYIGIITLDAILLLFRKKWGIRNLILFLSVIILFSSPWVFWSLKNYGVNLTLFSNTSSLWQQNSTFQQRLNKDIHNGYYTLLPLLSHPFIQLTSSQSNPWIRSYDQTFALYRSNIPGTLTFTFWSILLIYFLTACLSFIRKQYFISCNNRFLSAFIIFGFILSLPANPTADMVGVAHVTHLPVTLFLICIALKIIANLYHSGNKRTVVALISLFLIESFLVNGLRFYTLQTQLIPSQINSDTTVLQVHKDNWDLKSQYNLIFLTDLF